MRTKVLNILKNAGGFVSGQELCEMLQVSRTAIWKVIHQLQDEGYAIEAIRNKGYCLKELPDILNLSELNEKIKTRWAGKNLECYNTISSTNDRAKELAAANGVHGTLVVSDTQTGGKGRRGRSWLTDQGTAICMSMILRPQIPSECAPMLTLVTALAVAAGIEEVIGTAVQIKWPNDIVANGCKICGILTEMSGDMDSVCYVVVGVGINVNTISFDKEIQNKATSLYKLTGKVINRGDVVAAVMKYFEIYYEEFIKQGNLTTLMGEYDKKLVDLNRQVRVLSPGKEYGGTALGITSTGELIVQTDAGDIKKVLSGEVSVRGIYGYV